MPRKRELIVTNLTSKGFEISDGDHIFLLYRRLNGQKTVIRTKVSRGTSHKDVSDIILGYMAKQVRLPKKMFLELVDCTLDQVGFEEIVNP
jgi:hypothetical protein